MKQKYLILAIVAALGIGAVLVAAKPGQAQAMSNWVSSMHSNFSSNVSSQSSVNFNQSYQQDSGREYKMDYSVNNGHATWNYQTREPGGDWETISSSDNADTPNLGQPDMEQMMEDMHQDMMGQMPTMMNMTGMMGGMAM